MTNLGFFLTSGSRTHVRFQFSTHAAAGANVAPSSGFEAADLRIYKATDGAAFSATQRSSANGITMTSPFDSLTGYHDVDIDLTDNTDASFYAAGCAYIVVLAPDETVDSQTLTGVPLVYFEIGVPTANVTQNAGTAITAASGIQEVKVASIANNAITAASINADAITDAKVASDVTIASVTGAVGSVTGNVGGNVTGSVGSVVGAVGSVTGAVGSVTGNVGGNVVGSVGSVSGAVGSVTGNVGGNVTGSVGSVAAGGITAASIATDAIDADALAADAVTEIATGVWGFVVSGTRTATKAVRLMLAALVGKASGLGTATAVYRNPGDTIDAISASVDASGNRTAVTLDDSA